MMFDEDKSVLNLDVDRDILACVKLTFGERTQEKIIQFEKYRQNYKIDYFYRNKDKIETIAPFAYYCYRKLMDIKNIRLAFSYAENGLNTEIKKRMLNGEM